MLFSAFSANVDYNQGADRQSNQPKPERFRLACILLFVPRRIWPIVMVAALLTFAVYDLRIGLSPRTVFFFQLSDSAETLTAALGLSYAFGGPPKLDSVKALAKYAF